MEENNTDGKGLHTDESPGKEKTRRWVFLDFAKKGVPYALVLSIGIFVLYMAGSISDPGFSDHLLFFLLRILRYSSLVSCASSLVALGFSVHNLVYRPSFRSFMILCFYFAASVFSAALAMLDSFIVAATEGNV